MGLWSSWRYTCMRFFGFKWFGQTNPSSLLINMLGNIFSRYLTFCAFSVFSVYAQIHSAYSQYTNRFIPHILSVQTDSFRVFSVYEQRNLVQRFSSFCIVYIYCTYLFFPRILSIQTDLFRVFSVYVQIHSAYSENAAK
jgi:hypothetical protein